MIQTDETDECCHHPADDIVNHRGPHLGGHLALSSLATDNYVGVIVEKSCNYDQYRTPFQTSSYTRNLTIPLFQSKLKSVGQL